MTANIRIPVQVREDVLRVPNGALRFKPSDDKAGLPVKPPPQAQQKGPQIDQTVYVLNGMGVPEARKIQVGISDGLETEVTSGDLREGEAVVVSESRGK
jgi:HlyD family secretion protein